MIEGFGEELPEPEMADAIMAAHRLNQEIIALQYELLEAVGLPLARASSRPRPTRSGRSLYERYGERLRTAKQIVLKEERNAATKELLDTIIKELCPADGTPMNVPNPQAGGEEAVTPGRIKAGVHGGRGAGRPRADPRRQAARRPRPARPAADQVRGRPPAPGARLGPLPARRDAGPGHDRAGHRRRRAAGRRDHGRVQQEVHARLQHAAVRRRRGPADPRPGPARDRPRRPGRAVGRADPARPGAVPVHDPGRLRHPRIERLQLDGLGLRRHAQPDGRRRADHRPGRRHLDRPGPGRGQRPARPADRHHRRRGPLRRHGLQGRRHPARGHGHPARPQEPGDHRGDRPRDARAGPRGPAGDPPGDAPGDQAAARGDLGQRPAADPDPDQPREDRPDHRPGRQDDPPAPGRDRRQDRHRGQRHRHALEHSTPRGPRPPATRSWR